MAEDARIAQLEAELASLRAMCRFAPVGLCLVDRELRFLHVNERLAAIHGVPISEHMGRTVGEVIPDIVDQVAPAYRRVLDTGQPVRDLEVRGMLPSDRRHERVWLVNHHPVRLEGGVSGVVTAVLDITERRRAEEGLAAVKERLAEAQRVSGVGSWEWDILQDQVWWSDELYRLFEKDKGQFEPSFNAFVEGIHLDDRAKFRTQLEATLERNAPYVLEFRAVLDDGEVRVFLTSAALERTPDGLPWRLIGTLQDITERRRAERERLEAEHDPAGDETGSVGEAGRRSPNKRG